MWSRRVLSSCHKRTWSSQVRWTRGYASWKLVSGACDLPHPQKRATGGEDAWFIAQNAVGVADGVGGWARKGIDSGEYARTLMQTAHEEASKMGSDGPLDLLTKAYQSATCLGSSTACIVQLNDTMLRGVNIGDSGFIICRLTDVQGEAEDSPVRWQVVYEAPQQSHYFNCPYQLGYANSGDQPEMGETFEVELQEKDLIVLGTDGLFDNLFPEQIAAVLDTLMPWTMLEFRGPPRMENVASCLANTAHEAAKASKTHTPFAEAAKQAGYNFEGGKMDDITVVVSLIVGDSDDFATSSEGAKQKVTE